MRASINVEEDSSDGYGAEVEEDELEKVNLTN
jgi:hypothetical protein